MPFDRTRGIAAGPERQLFRKAFAEDGLMGAAGYDVAPDGRFLLVIPDEAESLLRSTCTYCCTSTTSSDGVYEEQPGPVLLNVALA